MAVLLLGLLIFLLTHSVRFYAPHWRTAQVARLGGAAWRGLYSALSLAGFALLVWGFGLARAAPVTIWAPPAAMRHVTALLVLVAFILLAAAYVPGTRIKARVGHPMILGVKVWAFAHLLANGRLADMILFGTFLAWAVMAYIASRRLDRAAGTTYPALGIGRDVIAAGVGAGAWALFAFGGHEWLIGVRPLG